MDYVLVGKLVNTHGIKGEVRSISDFEFKSRVFVKDVNLYIGDEKEKVTICSYRRHKNFDMCLFKEYNYINDVLKFKGKKVYVDRSVLNFSDDEFLDSDLIHLDVIYDEKNIGKIDDILLNNGYKLFVIGDKYIPYNDEFIENIDFVNRVIILKNLEGII